MWSLSSFGFFWCANKIEYRCKNTQNLLASNKIQINTHTRGELSIWLWTFWSVIWSK